MIPEILNKDSEILNKDELFPTIKLIISSFFSQITEIHNATRETSISLKGPSKTLESPFQKQNEFTFKPEIQENPLFFPLFSNSSLNKVYIKGIDFLLGMINQSLGVKKIKIIGCFGSRKELISYFRQKNLDSLKKINQNIPNVYLIQEKEGLFSLIFWLFLETSRIPSEKLLSLCTEYVLLKGENQETSDFLDNIHKEINFLDKNKVFSKKLGLNSAINENLRFLDSEVDFGTNKGLLLINKYQFEQNPHEETLHLHEFISFFRHLNVNKIENGCEMKSLKPLFFLLKKTLFNEINEKAEDTYEKINDLLFGNKNESIDLLLKNLKIKTNEIKFSEEELFFVNYFRSYPHKLNDIVQVLKQNTKKEFKQMKIKLLPSSKKSFLSFSTVESEEKELKKTSNIPQNEFFTLFLELFKFILHEEIINALLKVKDKIPEMLLDLEIFFIERSMKKPSEIMEKVRILLEDEVFERIIDKKEGFWNLRFETMAFSEETNQIKVLFFLTNPKKFLININELSLNETSNGDFTLINRASQAFQILKRFFAVFYLDSSGKCLVVNENSFLFDVFYCKNEVFLSKSQAKPWITFKEVYYLEENEKDQRPFENINISYLAGNLFVLNSYKKSLRIIEFSKEFEMVIKENTYDLGGNQMNFKRFIAIERKSGISIDQNNEFYRIYLENEIIIEKIEILNGFSNDYQFYHGFFSQNKRVFNRIFYNKNEKDYCLQSFSIEKNRVFRKINDQVLLRNVDEKLKPKFKEVLISENRSVLLTIFEDKFIKIPLNYDENQGFFSDLSIKSNSILKIEYQEFNELLLKIMTIENYDSLENLLKISIIKPAIFKIKKPILTIFSFDLNRKSDDFSVNFEVSEAKILCFIDFSTPKTRENLFLLKKILSIPDILIIKNIKESENIDFLENFLNFPRESSLIFDKKLPFYLENELLIKFAQYFKKIVFHDNNNIIAKSNENSKFETVFEFFSTIESIFTRNLSFSSNIREETRDFLLNSMKKELKKCLYFGGKSNKLEEIIAFKEKIPYRFEIQLDKVLRFDKSDCKSSVLESFNEIYKAFSLEIQEKFKLNPEKELGLLKSLIEGLLERRLDNYQAFYQEKLLIFEGNYNEKSNDIELKLKKFQNKHMEIEENIENLQQLQDFNENLHKEIRANEEKSLKFKTLKDFFLENFFEYIKENQDFLNNSIKIFRDLSGDRKDLNKKTQLKLDFLGFKANLDYLEKSLIDNIESLIFDIRNSESRILDSMKTLNADKIEIEELIYQKIILLRENEQNLTLLTEKHQILTEYLINSIVKNAKRNLFNLEFIDLDKNQRNYDEIADFYQLEEAYLDLLSQNKPEISIEIWLLFERFLVLLRKYDLFMENRDFPNEIAGKLMKFQYLLEDDFDFDNFKKHDFSIEKELISFQRDIENLKKMLEIENFKISILKDLFFKENPSYQAEISSFFIKNHKRLKFKGLNQGLKHHLRNIEDSIAKYNEDLDFMSKKQEILRKIPNTFKNSLVYQAFIEKSSLKYLNSFENLKKLKKLSIEIKEKLISSIEDSPSIVNIQAKANFRFSNTQEIQEFYIKNATKINDLEKKKTIYKNRQDDLMNKTGTKTSEYKENEEKLNEISAKIDAFYYCEKQKVEEIRRNLEKEEEKNGDLKEFEKNLIFVGKNGGKPEIFRLFVEKVKKIECEDKEKLEELKEKAEFYMKKAEFDCFLKKERAFVEERKNIGFKIKDIKKKNEESAEKIKQENEILATLVSYSDLNGIKAFSRLGFYIKNTKFRLFMQKNLDFNELYEQILLYIESFEGERLDKMMETIERYMTLCQVSKEIEDSKWKSREIKEQLNSLEEKKQEIIKKIENITKLENENNRRLCENLLDKVKESPYCEILMKIQTIEGFVKSFIEIYNEFMEVLKRFEAILSKLKEKDLKNPSFLIEIENLRSFKTLKQFMNENIQGFFQRKLEKYKDLLLELKFKENLFNNNLVNTEKEEFYKEIRCFSKEFQGFSLEESENLINYQSEPAKNISKYLEKTEKMLNLMLPLRESLGNLDNFLILSDNLEEISLSFKENLKDLRELLFFHEFLYNSHDKEFESLDFYLNKLIDFYEEINEIIINNNCFAYNCMDFTIFNKNKESLEFLIEKFIKKKQKNINKIEKNSQILASFESSNRNFIDKAFLINLENFHEDMIHDFPIGFSHYFVIFCDICRIPLYICPRNHQSTQEISSDCLENCDLCLKVFNFSFCSIKSPHSGPHLCASSHKCLEKCSKQGFCEISQDFYTGKSISSKLLCCVQIPPNRISHEGDHFCSILNIEKTHYCGRKCLQCLNCCIRPFHFEGLCNTNHGFLSQIFLKFNNVYFLNQKDPYLRDLMNEIYQGFLIKEKAGIIKITCPESCLLFGRGHKHALKCEDLCKSQDDRLESDRFYHHSNGFDYMTCIDYFERHLSFQQPIIRANFDYCGYICRDPTHELNEPHYCQEKLSQKLSHKPIFYKKQRLCSLDGHVFDCQSHNKGIRKALHIVVLIDCGTNEPWFEWVNKGLNETYEKYDEGVYLSFIVGTADLNILLERVNLNSREFLKKEKIIQNFTNVALNLDSSFIFFLNLDSSLNKCLNTFIAKFGNDYLIFVVVSNGNSQISNPSIEQVKTNVISNNIEFLTLAIGGNGEIMKKIAEFGNKSRYLKLIDNWNIGDYCLKGSLRAKSYEKEGFYLEEHEEIEGKN